MVSDPHGRRTHAPVRRGTHAQDGHDLAERLVRPVGNVQMRAAVRLLGRYRNGFWLHLFCEQSAENESVGLGSLLEYPDGHPTVDWNAVGLRLLDGPWNVGSPSELAVLQGARTLMAARLRDGRPATVSTRWTPPTCRSSPMR